MPREEKRPLELRPVDEDGGPEPDVIRLHQPGDVQDEEQHTKPVRLGRVSDDGDAPNRLFVPERREMEIRTHQPGIEALIDDSTAVANTEQSWGEESASRQPIPWGWFALIALAIAAAVVWSLGRLRESRDTAVMIREETETVLLSDEREETEARALIDRMESVLTAFFTARQVDEWQGLIRHPARVMPLIRAHYNGAEELPGPMRSLNSLAPLTINMRGNFWMASVMLASGEFRSILMEIDEHGDPRLDWETFVCHQPMPWDEFARQRPEDRTLDFRVYVELDNFHSHEFANSNEWQSMRLTALHADETLFGYIRRDHGELPEIMRNLQLNEGRKTSLILRLNIPRGLQSRRGVVIEKMVSPRWLYTDSPFTDS